MTFARRNELVFEAGRVRIGRFRARPGDAWFRQDVPAGGWLVVFPRLAVRITHAGHRGVIADPTVVTLYNKGQEYTRALVSPDGDACEFFSFDARDVVDAVRAHDGAVADRPLAPFVHTHVSSDPRMYAKQRVLAQLVATPTLEPLAIEEASLQMLGAIVARAYAREVVLPSAGAARAHANLADAWKEVLAARFREKLTLSEVADAVGASTFHVCRVFRRETCLTVHAYLEALRLHAALDVLPDRVADLTALALDLGYSSHSHFTAAFRRRFGVPPSQLRAALVRTERDALSKILTARIGQV